MGLIVKPKDKKAITIDGLPDFKPTQCYIRLRFLGQSDGQTLEIQLDTFSSKEQFAEGKTVPMMFEVQGKSQVIPAIQNKCLPTETQSVETAHRITKDFFVELGYDVTTDLV